jgi:hypothetical protein
LQPENDSPKGLLSGCKNVGWPTVRQLRKAFKELEDLTGTEPVKKNAKRRWTECKRVDKRAEQTATDTARAMDLHLAYADYYYLSLEHAWTRYVALPVSRPRDRYLHNVIGVYSPSVTSTENGTGSWPITPTMISPPQNAPSAPRAPAPLCRRAPGARAASPQGPRGRRGPQRLQRWAQKPRHACWREEPPERPRRPGLPSSSGSIWGFPRTVGSLRRRVAGTASR